MKRIFLLLGSILIVVVVALIGWFVLQRADASRVSIAADDLATARRGTLIATVSATGTIEPIQQAALAFTTGGTLKELLVTEGARVKKGDVLARLETRDLALSLAQAEANVKSAQAKLAQVTRGASDADRTSAQANLASAEAAYAKLLKPDPNELAAAQADLDKTRAAVAQAQANYDRIGGDLNPLGGAAPQALALQNATLDYQKAQAAYNAKFAPTDAQLKQARAQIDQARAALAKLTPAAEDIAVAQANVDAARAARDLAQFRLEQASLTAPFDAVVLTIDPNVGDYVSPGRTVMKLADVSKFQTHLNIDETDIAKIRLGQAVDITLDAYPDAAITGKISEIAPGATVLQGVVNYVVTVAIDPAQVEVKPGMTANADVQVVRKENALLIPSRAIRAANQQHFVTIRSGQATREVEVKIGLSNDQETEIVSGLNEGDEVLLTVVPTNRPPGFGGQ